MSAQLIEFPVSNIADPVPGLDDLPPIMSPQTLGQHIELDPKTLERWRKTWPAGECLGPAWSNPPGTKFYRYYRRDVLAWINAGLIEEEKPEVAASGQNRNA